MTMPPRNDDDFLFRLRLAAAEGNRTCADTLAPLIEENTKRVQDEIEQYVSDIIADAGRLSDPG
jgi:hypothetical protein